LFFSNTTLERTSDAANLPKSDSSKIEIVYDEIFKNLLPDAASDTLSNVVFKKKNYSYMIEK